MPENKHEEILKKSIIRSIEYSWEGVCDKHRNELSRNHIFYQIYAFGLEQHVEICGLDSAPFYKLLQDYQKIWDSINKEELCPITKQPADPTHS